MDDRNFKNFISSGVLVLILLGLIFGAAGLKYINSGHFTVFSISEEGESNILRLETMAQENNVMVDEEVYHFLEDGKAQLIVEFNDDSGKQASSIMSTGSNEENFKVIQEYETLNAAAIEVDAKGFETLISSGKIKRVYNDEVLDIQLQDSAPQINADYAWDKNVEGGSIKGNGQAVCLIDTGVDYNNAALSGRVVAQKCFCSVSGVACCPNGENTDEDAMDDNGHGTHVAGIIASDDATYTGIAPEADIIAVKVCNSAGSCSSSGILSGLEFCTSNAEAYNISAISISIGGVTPYSSYCDSISATMTSAINNAVLGGVIVSIASGNYNNVDGVSWPSCVEKATTVSAVDKDDIIADYSNRAPITDLLGIGGSSLRPINSLALSGGFTEKYGTSMAAPHVAAAAVLIQQYSQIYNGIVLSPANVEEILRKTGKSITDPSTGREYYRIDLKSAIDSILRVDSSDISITKEEIAKINFDENVDLGLASYAFYASHNLIGLDSSTYPSLDVPATLILYNLSFEKIPVILKNGELCDDCLMNSYENGNASFHVNGFSNYSCAANANISIWDSSYYGTQFYSGNATLNKNTTFFCSYVNISDGQSIAEASCNISFPENSSAMGFDSSTGLYEFSRDFSSEGIYAYEVSCSGESSEAMSVLGSVEVTRAYPSLILKVNERESNISVLRNMDVVINASMADPAEDLSVYIDGAFMGSGRAFDSITSFSELSLINITAVYNGSPQYHPASKTIFVDVIEDTIPPQFSNFSLSEVRFGEDQSVSVNVNDNIGVENVWIEINFSDLMNHSTACSSDGVCYYNISGLAIGNYSYIWHANDSSGNENSSETMVLNLIKGNNLIKLYLNGQQNNITMTYGNSLNVTAIGKGDVSLYRNNVLVNNPDTSILDVNSSGYIYFANSSGNENYTENSSQSMKVYINKASSDIDLKIDGRHRSTTTSEGEIELLAEIKIPSSGTVKIYKGSTLLDSGSSPLETIESFSPGTYTINSSYDGGTNYFSSSEWFTLTVSEVSTNEASSSTSSSSSSGTSSPSISLSCSEQWRCTQWGDCKENSQIRTCYDVNNCVPSDNKPSEKQNCETISPAPLLSGENKSEMDGGLNDLYIQSLDIWKKIYAQIYDEPIILLPMVGIIIAGILLVVNELSIARTRLKKLDYIKKIIKKHYKK
ncbi:MAG: S8 family serine peptidase [Nanoarchaeota archaeon]|nr:S8 family serine peptidase [Nanoarchaeota archaeon]